MRAALLLLLAAAPARAVDAAPPPKPPSAVLPTYVALAPNIHDFDRFADGGPDANWYIGYNNAWIVKLPPPPLGDFARAFVGAKIGRAKTRPNEEKPWLRERVDGKVYMAISQTAAFTAEQSYFLVETADIPLEGDPRSHVEGVGSAEWFWTEVPLGMVSFTRPNYLIVWSPTSYFLGASSSPILAAAGAEDPPSAEPRAWNNHAISGVPPRHSAAALQTPLKALRPALALKLVPPAEIEVSVTDFSVQRLGKKAVVQFSSSGENVSEGWVESSRDQLDWERVSRVVRRQPFQFTIPAEKAAPGLYLRGAARDAGGGIGYGAAHQVPYETQ